MYSILCLALLLCAFLYIYKHCVLKPNVSPNSRRSTLHQQGVLE